MMKFARGFLALLGIAFGVAQCRAHFVFLLPGSEGQPARLIFSDSPVVDAKSTAENLAVKPLQIVRPDNQVAEVKPVLEKGASFWTLPRNENLNGVVSTSLEYGVVNLGEGERHMIRYHAKLVNDLSKMPKDAGHLPLDITPRKAENGLVFLVTIAGKPLANKDVVVHEPGQAKSKVVKTDLAGLTPAFTTAGEYGLRVAYTDAKAGEFEGRKYRLTKHYSTLVVILPGN